jgi:hypothetical protein
MQTFVLLNLFNIFGFRKVLLLIWLHRLPGLKFYKMLIFS